MSEDCPHCVFEKTEANCPGCFEGSHYRPKPITNADRIRSMSEKELSYLIADNVDCNRRCKAWKEGCEYSDSTCRQAWLDWLKKEVEP